MNNNLNECPICKGNNSEFFGEVSSVYSTKPYTLVSCLNCSHIYLSNPPDQAELSRIYDETYNYSAHLEISSEKKWRIRKTLAVFEKIVPKNARIIDVGCMYGFFLEELRSLGYNDLLGIEIGSNAVKECRRKGFDVFEGTFEKWIAEGGTGENNKTVCFVLSHVIEHIADVKDYLIRLNKYLKEGDYLILLVPNSRAGTAAIFKKHWGWWQVPVHIHHFSEQSLRRLFEDRGFSILKTVKRGADSLFWLLILSSIFGLKSKKDVISLYQKLAIKISSLVLKYWYFLGDEELITVSKKIKK
ncbi:MAG: class I SAM-dependent methyltransferase [Elusimicrobia bacterium]|nr:class I SAM-dependent methyltransferase [Candidatus Liberimonas magnetica]